MTWLVRLYPPAWRRRYGRELEELLATRPASLGVAFDLVVGALDAWFNPQPSAAGTAADAKGAGAMVSTMLQLRCTGNGPNVSKEDRRKAGVVTLSGSLALALALTWATARFGRNSYIESLLLMGWLVPWFVSQHYTSLKGRSGLVQAAVIGGQSAFVIAVALATAWINSR
jgi:hypothetical protein